MNDILKKVLLMCLVLCAVSVAMGDSTNNPCVVVSVSTNCLDNGTLTGAVSASPSRVCIHGCDEASLSFSASASDSGGQIEVVTTYDYCPAESVTSSVSASPAYVWAISGPKSASGSGSSASLTTTNEGSYSCTFTVTASRECPPSSLALATNAVVVRIGPDCGANTDVSPTYPNLGPDPDYPNCNSTNHGWTHVGNSDVLGIVATACYDGGEWRIRVVSVASGYYQEICNQDGLPVVDSATDPSVTSNTYCEIIADLTTGVGDNDPLTFYYPAACVQIHEEHHLDEWRVHLNEKWQTAESAIENLSIPFSCDDVDTESEAVTSLAPSMITLIEQANMDALADFDEDEDGAIWAQIECVQNLVDTILARATVEGWASCP